MKFEGDPYQIEYALIQDVEVLREGEWNWFKYGKEFIDEIALTYDPKVLRAKLITDHSYDGPAYGHILALRAEDDPDADGAVHLVATVGFLPEGVAMVESGQYNERSIGWASFHPFIGLAYLWEVSLLGANTPAAVGMNPIIFEKEKETEMLQQLAIDRANEGLTAAEINAKQLIWEKTEDYIHYQVRKMSRFRDETMRTIELDADEGIMATTGKLKKEYLGENKPESMVIQSVMFSLKKGWTLKKAKDWIGERELTALTIKFNPIVPFQDLSIADEDEKRDLDAAESRRREYAGGDEIDWDKYRGAFLWSDFEKKESPEGYKLPIADVIDGELRVIPEAIAAAATSIDTAVPEEDIPGVKAHLEKYYAKMERKAPWQNESPEGIDIKTEANDSTILEGGEPKMPDIATQDNIIVVEPGSSVDLAARNAAERALKEAQDSETQAKLIRENERLRVERAAARLEAIKSDVRTMQAEGYIVPAQVEAGLINALAAVPDEAEVLVGDKKVKAREILIGALKFGGKLKLKHEFAKDVLPDDTTDDLAKAESLGINVDVERRVRKLREENPTMSYAKALDRATREVKR